MGEKLDKFADEMRGVMQQAGSDVSASYQSILTQDAGWNSPSANYDTWLSQQISQDAATEEINEEISPEPEPDSEPEMEE
jgi:hypothetical protein